MDNKLDSIKRLWLAQGFPLEIIFLNEFVTHYQTKHSASFSFRVSLHKTRIY